jgi:hypothetical protein
MVNEQAAAAAAGTKEVLNSMKLNFSTGIGFRKEMKELTGGKGGRAGRGEGGEKAGRRREGKRCLPQLNGYAKPMPNPTNSTYKPQETQ